MKPTNIQQFEDKPLKVLVVGATGGTGIATVETLLKQGHQVTAFSRNANSLSFPHPGFRIFEGDAMRIQDLEQAVQGHDVVIVTLGIQENPLRVRLFGTRGTPMDVRSAGTRNVVRAMAKHGVRRLVVQSTYGIGDTAGLLGFADRMFFSLLLKPQIKDTQAQEHVVRESGVDWTLAQPVHLTNLDDDKPPYLSVSGKTREMKVTRQSVAKFLANAATTQQYVGQSVAVSG